METICEEQRVFEEDFDWLITELGNEYEHQRKVAARIICGGIPEGEDKQDGDEKGEDKQGEDEQGEDEAY